MTDQEPSRTRSEMLAEGRDLDRPDSHDSASSILLRLEAQLEENLPSGRLILFGLFVVETLSSLCLLFIIIYSLYMNAHQP